jgi:hypothetical protein
MTEAGVLLRRGRRLLFFHFFIFFINDRFVVNVCFIDKFIEKLFLGRAVS